MPTFTLQKVHVVPKKKFKIKIKKKKPFNLNNATKVGQYII